MSDSSIEAWQYHKLNFSKYSLLQCTPGTKESLWMQTNVVSAPILLLSDISHNQLYSSSWGCWCLFSWLLLSLVRNMFQVLQEELGHLKNWWLSAPSSSDSSPTTSSQSFLINSPRLVYLNLTSTMICPCSQLKFWDWGRRGKK